VAQGEFHPFTRAALSFGGIRVSHLCPKSREGIQNLPKSTECVMLTLL
jgi:hypothetical protein